ncbi:MAG: MmcB family DNA repair protein [Marinobacter sp.]
MPDDSHTPSAWERTRSLAATPPEPRPGQMLARGVCRHMVSHGFVTVEELVPTSGLRVDVMALGPRGEIWIIECKSSRADFTSDRKWEGYLEWCDRFFWAVDDAFPTDLLPEDTGLIVADSYDAEILRMPPEAKLPGARRKVMMQKFARHAARRLQALRDPGLSLSC